MATKENRRQAKAIVEELETRVHAGPPIDGNEILSAHDFLRQSDFSPASDYFGRLKQIQHRLAGRPTEPQLKLAKRDYSGEAAGYWMQVQAAYDHVILSICYEGEFNCKRGRVKISHRFNQEGRLDFVEAKLLRSMDPCLNGAFRKLLMIQNFQSIRKGWLEAEAFVLEILPRELIFLYDNLFRCERDAIFTWLNNVGHRLVGDLLEDLSGRPRDGVDQTPGRNPGQLDLSALRTDRVAWPILVKAALLESVVEIADSKTAVVRYRGG